VAAIGRSNEDERDETSLSEVEALKGGVLVEWIEHRQIVVYRTPDSSRTAVQTLFDRAEEIVLGWPADRPYLAILDFSADRIGATPYARTRGQGTLALRPELKICMVMLTARSVQAQVMQVIARTKQRADKLLAVHFSQEEAVAWLKKVGGIG